MSARVQAWRRRTAGIHLVSMATCVALVISGYREGVEIGIALFLCAVLIELLQRDSVRELTAAGVILTSVFQVSGTALTPDMFAAWLRLILAFLVLVPARPGALKFLIPLLVADTLFGEPPQFNELMLLVLIPVWLALDAWLRDGVQRSRYLRVTRPITPSWPRRLLVPALAVSLLLATTLPMAGASDRRHLRNETDKPIARSGRHKPSPFAAKSPGTQSGSTSGLSRDITVGDSAWTDLDNGLVGQVTVDKVFVPVSVYIRTLTLPDLKLGGNRVGWVLKPTTKNFDQRGDWLHSRHSVIPVQVAMSTDLGGLIPLPDGTCLVRNTLRSHDIHGNLFRANEDEANTLIETDLGSSSYPALPTRDPARNSYFEIPALLRDRLRSLAPIDTWAQFEAPQAAAAITLWLRNRCRYDIHDLPEGKPGPGGALWSFLDGRDTDRRGHCQYFSTAAVLMLRAAGHPARCVTGYASTEVEGQTFQLRHHHAHAWAETLTPDNIWHRVEATPPSGLTMRAERFETEEAEQANSQPIETKVALFLERQGNVLLTLVGLALVVLTAIWFATRKRQHKTGPSPRAVNRFRRQLERLCRHFGIRLRKSMTVSDLIGRLEEVTGKSLWLERELYLRFRYGNEDIQVIWPTIAELEPEIQ